MSRRTITINLSTRNPDKFLTLCEKVIEHNTSLGTSSPFADGNIVDMAAYKARVEAARAARERALDLYAQAQAAMFESRQLMGIAPGQSSTTPDTLYNLTLQIKKMLLVLETLAPEAISLWGFDVVIRTARVRGRKKVEDLG